MNSSYKETIWKQFGGTIDMMENAIRMCPEKLWNNENKFWYKAFHALFYLDYYLTVDPDSYSPPTPFTTSEFDPSGKMPDRVYTKEELLSYVKASKQKLHDVMNNMTDEIALQRWVNSSINNSFFEMLIYNMRHLQHHTAQLNLLLRLGINDAPPWVAKTVGELNESVPAS